MNPNIGLQQQHPLAHMAADPIGAGTPPQFGGPASTIDIAAMARLSAEQLVNEAVPDPNTPSP